MTARVACWCVLSAGKQNESVLNTSATEPSFHASEDLCRGDAEGRNRNRVAEVNPLSPAWAPSSLTRTSVHIVAR